MRYDLETYGFKTPMEKLKAMLFLPKPPSKAMMLFEILSGESDIRPSNSLQERLDTAAEAKLSFWRNWLGYAKVLRESIVDGWVVPFNGKYYFAYGKFNNKPIAAESAT